MTQIREHKRQDATPVIAYYNGCRIEGDLIEYESGASLVLYQTPLLFLQNKETMSIANTGIRLTLPRDKYRRAGQELWIINEPTFGERGNKPIPIYSANKLPLEEIRLPNRHELFVVSQQEPFYATAVAPPEIYGGVIRMPYVCVDGISQEQTLEWKVGHIPPIYRMYKDSQIPAVFDLLVLWESLFEEIANNLFGQDLSRFENMGVARSAIENANRSFMLLERATGAYYLIATKTWCGESLDAQKTCHVMKKRTGLDLLLGQV